MITSISDLSEYFFKISKDSESTVLLLTQNILNMYNKYYFYCRRRHGKNLKKISLISLISQKSRSGEILRDFFENRFSHGKSRKKSRLVPVSMSRVVHAWIELQKNIQPKIFVFSCATPASRFCLAGSLQACPKARFS